MSEKRFHQMIYIQHGPVKSVIFDFLKKNVLRVETEELRAFENRELSGDCQFVQNLDEEDLLIEFEGNAWIPSMGFEINELLRKKVDMFELEIDDGVDLDSVRDAFKGYIITGVTQFGASDAKGLFPNAIFETKEKNYEHCKSQLIQKHELGPLSEELYEFNMNFNTCWGRKVAVKANGDISPCIYSDVIVGNIDTEDVDLILGKITQYWIITKDYVDKCKDCELRYFCFDCREISRRVDGDLYASNPFCEYDPHRRG